MNVKELYSRFDTLIPKTLSCAWDNDGLMVCPYPSGEVKKVLLSLDITEDVAAYAADYGFDVIISHHPLVFHPLHSLNADEPDSKTAVSLIMAGISAMSFHTRFDAVDGGINDILCAKLGLKVSGFLAEDGINVGRICDTDISFPSLCTRVRDVTGSPCIQAVTAHGAGSRRVRKLAVVGGGGKDFIGPALSAGADALLTGEVSYNAMLDAAKAGLSVIAAGHYYTEYIFSDYFSKALSELSVPSEVCPLGCEVIYI